jgi:hypothetical protein
VSDDRVCRSHRRYCFLKYRRATLDSNENATVWDSKRRTIAGTTIPASFPSRADLISAGYLVTEEIVGATSTELIKAGLSSSAAAAVIAALE